MHTLNIGEREIQKQMEPVHDLYKDSLDNVLDSNIDNIVASINDTTLLFLMQSISAILPDTF